MQFLKVEHSTSVSHAVNLVIHPNIQQLLARQ